MDHTAFIVRLYGIKNCNTVKKSIDWLNGQKINFEFMDVKKGILDEKTLSEWIENLPNGYSWESLVNKSGITWRKLDDEQKKIAGTQIGVFGLIIEKPSIMKRPVITNGNKVLTIGFDELKFSEQLL